MEHAAASFIHSFFGLENDPSLVLLGQMSMRAVLVFISALFILRLAPRRFLGRYAPFDTIVAFIIGSLLSRTINGKAPLFESIAIVFLIVALHSILSLATIKLRWFDRIVKGQPRELVSDGRVHWDALKQSHMGEGDLMEAIRLSGGIDDINRAHRAVLERNGHISVVKKEN